MATAESRHVMKALASFGVGGAAGVFFEKLAHILFPEAYEMEDPTYKDVREEDEAMAKQRQAFVEELFENKGTWNRRISKGDEIETDNVYKEVKELITKYQKDLCKTLKTKLARERQHLDSNSAAFQRKMRQNQTADADITDNLVKMTVAIVDEVKLEKLVDMFSIIKSADNEGFREEITQIDAETFFNTW